MDTDSIIQIITIIILLLLSAFFSSAETAFTMSNRIKIRSLIDEGNKRAKTVESILNNSKKMLSAILIGNNIVNISVSAIATALTIRIWGSYATGIATGILTILVLIFGEITPKTIATVNPEKLSLKYAPIVKIIMIIFTPVIFIIDHLSSIVLKILHINNQSKTQSITEDELRTFVKVSHEQGVIETNEKKIINNLFDFSDSQAKDIMIPRIDMTMVDINTSYDDIMHIFQETKYTRIPIYENDPDNVIGILNIKDLILKPDTKHFNLRTVLRKAYFTYEHKNISDLFKEMQRNSQSIVIIVDEYGSTAGMITTEDLLEEIVGDIRDEYDTDEKDAFKKVNANTYRIDGTYKLNDLNDELGLNLYSDDNDSIGGFIIENLDRIPLPGDKLVLNNLEFTVEHASATRIEVILLKVLSEDEHTVTQ